MCDFSKEKAPPFYLQTSSLYFFADWDDVIVPSETVTSIFRSEQKAMFTENATERKCVLICRPCFLLPCSEVNHEAKTL